VALAPTPSQTVGPFFHLGLPWRGWHSLVDPGDPGALVLRGVVTDAQGAPVDDALVEIWQANRSGRYAHPEDVREEIPLEAGFVGFGRCATDAAGGYEFVTVKPGPIPGPGGGLQAPHIEMSVFARGLLKRLVTRVYFPDEAQANEADLALASVDDPQARSRLIAVTDGDGLRFDICLQGDRETPFFAV
jgi:protocatechuate 3,4-dioxygenase alpha subunit